MDGEGMMDVDGGWADGWGGMMDVDGGWADGWGG